MPELPEVETIRRDLAVSITGETIRSCEVYLPRLITCPTCDEYCASLKGARIEEVGRRGKYLIFSLNRPWEWIVHLGMTGALLLDEEGSPAPKHTHIVLHLKRPRILRYVDPRTFGESAVVPTGDYGALKSLAAMGPEPLARSFTVKALGRALATGAKVKPALMDQRRIAGIGNIYADEILFRAGIDPQRPAATLDEEELERLHKAIKQVLRAAIARRGSSVVDYVDASGSPGSYQHSHLVYRRAGEPCAVCGQPIQRCVIGGRSSHWCPKCQI
jgi:formamidopyrimidine-DNA glycosylase